ncbi:GNAT family N-acetyltransferase [Candidatus Saccharibacteria bacterium]|nr:GNAT family N-acetyltransferase [Candidatus Saccharibacteria bacterium]
MKHEQQQRDGMPLETVVNDDCSLRVLRPDDAERIFEILQADSDISTKYVTWLAGATSAEDIAERTADFNSRKALRYAIVADGTLVGYVGAWQHHFDPESAEYDLGYFCDPQYRGQGLVTASTNHLMDLLVQHMNAQSFALYINDHNTGSQAVAKKLGYTRTEETGTDRTLGVDERRWEKRA